jgi:hypothetical protein
MILVRSALALLVAFLQLAVMAEGSSAFRFPEDTFAFTNELKCVYEWDTAQGRMVMRKRVPPPEYALRCVAMSRMARQFWVHAQFEPNEPKATRAQYGYLIGQVLRRSARAPRAHPDQRLIIPGFANLREFSREYQVLLKEKSGGAWQSFVQRGNWRMVFPFSGAHQERTAQALKAALAQNDAAVVHAACFPALTLNHVVVLYGFQEDDEKVAFSAYDPNIADGPVAIVYERDQRRFFFPKTHYFLGGPVKLYRIYHGFLF